MSDKVIYALIVLLALAYSRRVKSQYCSPITIEALGNPSVLTKSGLLTELIFLDRGSPPPEPLIRIIDYTVVCSSPGSQRNTYSYVSVVVEFQCKSLYHRDCDGETVLTWQFHFACVSHRGRTRWVRHWEYFYIENPTANMTTPLDTQCRRCVDPRVNSPSYIDPLTHCECEFVNAC